MHAPGRRCREGRGYVERIVGKSDIPRFIAPELHTALNTSHSTLRCAFSSVFPDRFQISMPVTASSIASSLTAANAERSNYVRPKKRMWSPSVPCDLANLPVPLEHKFAIECGIELRVDAFTTFLAPASLSFKQRQNS